jgi:hypothetical protein
MNPPQPQLKPLKASLNLLLVLLAGNLISSSDWIVKLSGVVFAVGAIGIHRRNELSDRDYTDGIGWLSREFREGITTVAHEVMPTRRELKTLYVRVKEPQEPFKLRLDSFAERLLESEWFPEFTRRSKIICGDTGSGKTTLQLYDVANFLNKHPEGHLTICDLDYGSSHEGSEPNYWFHLPQDRYIRKTYEATRDAIFEEFDILEKRAELSSEGKGENWQWRMLAIDEAISVFRRAKQVAELAERGTEEKKEFTRLSHAIGELLYRGLKQRIKVSFGCQALEVGETGLSLAQQRQVNVILLGANALDSDSLGRVGVENKDAMKSKLRQTRRIPGCQYAAVVRDRGEVAVRVVPKIDPSAITIDVLQDQVDELERWWASVFTEEVKQWMLGLAGQHVSGVIKSPLKTEICPRFGIQKALLNDPKYCKVAEAWKWAKNYVSGISPDVEEPLAS